jgi:hypothetical protein
VDEKPNIQVLERRHPTRPGLPGLIERREFEYWRCHADFIAHLEASWPEYNRLC